MDIGELITRWTVRLALAFYASTLALRWSGLPSSRSLHWARVLWTAGAVFFLCHVLAAFQYYHHWSHSEAYEATLKRTAADTGVASGFGLYLNYLFLLVWWGDAAWWWSGNVLRYAAHRPAVQWAVDGFMLFMAFNGGVIFASGPTRWVGLAISGLLAWLLWRKTRAKARC